MTTFRVRARQPFWVEGYIDIEQDEDWDGHPVVDEFDARDLAYDLIADGSDRVVWLDGENGEFELDGVEVLDGV